MITNMAAGDKVDDLNIKASETNVSETVGGDVRQILGFKGEHGRHSGVENSHSIDETRDVGAFNLGVMRCRRQWPLRAGM